MPARLRRCTWLLALPVLVGVLLVMHGLDAHPGDSHHSGRSTAAPVVAAHPHEESTPGDHAHCVDCLAGHVMAACVAILATIGGIGLARRMSVRPCPAASAGAVASRVRGLVELARPPDPAWVRLSVMRC